MSFLRRMRSNLRFLMADAVVNFGFTSYWFLQFIEWREFNHYYIKETTEPFLSACLFGLQAFWFFTRSIWPADFRRRIFLPLKSILKTFLPITNRKIITSVEVLRFLLFSFSSEVLGVELLCAGGNFSSSSCTDPCLESESLFPLEDSDSLRKWILKNFEA